VIEAAAALAAESGYDAVSMRALGERLGVSGMALYRYVTTKEDLLGALADRILGELDLPGPDEGTWQEQIHAVMTSLHRVLLTHPELAAISARQHLNGRHAYEGAEVVLAALRRAGVTGEAAAVAFGTLTSYTIGFSQRQTGTRSEQTLAVRLSVVEELPAERFRNITELGSAFLLRHSDRQFEDGLHLIIAGIEAGAGRR
jgi:AcrR family transcriptional regulator